MNMRMLKLVSEINSPVIIKTKLHPLWLLVSAASSFGISWTLSNTTDPFKRNRRVTVALIMILFSWWKMSRN